MSTHAVHPLRAGKVAALRRASGDAGGARVRDTERLAGALRYFSIRHYLTVRARAAMHGVRPRCSLVPAGCRRHAGRAGSAAPAQQLTARRRAARTPLNTRNISQPPRARAPQSSQLVELLALLPPSDAACAPLRVEAASAFWARCVDRRQGWSDVLRALEKEEQVCRRDCVAAAVSVWGVGWSDVLRALEEEEQVGGEAVWPRRCVWDRVGGRVGARQPLAPKQRGARGLCRAAAKAARRLTLPPPAQVSLCRRLGYAVVFDPVRPGGLHYRLRMFRADEHQVAWRLHRMSLTTKSECFQARRGGAMEGGPRAAHHGQRGAARVSGGRLARPQGTQACAHTPFPRPPPHVRARAGAAHRRRGQKLC